MAIYKKILECLVNQEFFYLITGRGSILRLIVEDGEGDFLECLLDAAAKLKLQYTLIDRQDKNEISTIEEARNVLCRTSLLRVILSTTDEKSELEVLIERWWDNDGTGSLQGVRNNRWVSKLWKGNPLLSKSRVGGVNLRHAVPADVRAEAKFDVDYVFSWVNSDDPVWQDSIASYRPRTETDATSPGRWRAKNDLKYALRSIERFAPWVRNVIVFTDCSPPDWLDLEQNGIRWVYFTEVFEERHLPTFNSHAIEAYVHKIPGLSEHFIYSCDDYFLARHTRKEDFFLSNGSPRVRLELFGMVNGPVREGQPAYLNAARNSAECIFRDFGKYPTQLHTHSPQSLRRSILEEMERRYETEIEHTRASKFRGINDVVMTGFFFAHYAISCGRAVAADTPTRLIKHNHNFEERMRSIELQITVGGESEFLSICLNDGLGSHLNQEWDEAADKFLNSIFPHRS